MRKTLVNSQTEPAGKPLNESFQIAKDHPLECTCADCMAVTDAASEHRYNCGCDMCLRWWHVMGPEQDVD